MVKRYRHEDSLQDILWQAVVPVIGLYFLWLLLLYFGNRVAYWRWFWYGIVAIIVVVGLIFGLRELRYRHKQKKLDVLLGHLKQTGADEYVTNFINRFGLDKKKDDAWAYRGYSFDWDRLKDFRKVLNEKGVHLASNDWKDVSALLRHYIQEKEERLTRDSIGVAPRRINELSGTDFEILLYRLFEAMKYSVQKTGKTGDQGGDLIINKDGQRIIVQAKRHTGSVNNSAIQEAVAAQKFYDCAKAMVVTNSEFTSSAIVLGKLNGVEMVSGKILRDWLIQYLKENWG